MSRNEPPMQVEPIKNPARPKFCGHVVNTFSGAVGQKLVCHSCRRALDEAQFTPIGTLITKGQVRQKLHPHCRTCRRHAKGKWAKHPLYTPAIGRYFAEYVSSLRANARSRGIYFGIDEQDLIEKYLKQEGICALSGLRMELNPTKRKLPKTARRPSLPSCDRIDSGGHYTPDNIQIVFAAVNTMKGEMPQQVFIELCQQIAIKNIL